MFHLLLPDTKKEDGKIRLESMYPYTYVRTTVMRTKLFTKHDYDKLLKMQYSEIAKFLQDSEYKSEIDELAVKYSGLELLELALIRNLTKTFKKLKAISSPEMNLLIEAYLMKYDILNIKTIVRGLFTKANPDYIKKLLVPAGRLTNDQLSELLRKSNLDDVFKSVPFINYQDFQPLIQGLKERGALFELENALDKLYYSSLISLSQRIPSAGSLFKKFIFAQIEATNLMVVVRMMKEHAHKEEIKKYIFYTNIREEDSQIDKVLHSKSMEEIPAYLSNNNMKKFMQDSIEHFKQTKSLTEFERKLSKYMLEKAILFTHQHPLSIEVILGFMFAKEIEVQNLMKIIKGKELGLEEKQIEAEIVA